LWRDVEKGRSSETMLLRLQKNMGYLLGNILCGMENKTATV